jgi:hypothetical protein
VEPACETAVVLPRIRVIGGPSGTGCPDSAEVMEDCEKVGRSVFLRHVYYLLDGKGSKVAANVLYSAELRHYG